MDFMAYLLASKEMEATYKQELAEASHLAEILRLEELDKKRVNFEYHHTREFVQNLLDMGRTVTMEELEWNGILDDYGFAPKETDIEMTIYPMPVKHLPAKLRRQKRLSPKNHLRDKAKHGFVARKGERETYDHWELRRAREQMKKSGFFFKMELDLI